MNWREPWIWWYHRGVDAASQRIVGSHGFDIPQVSNNLGYLAEISGVGVGWVRFRYIAQVDGKRELWRLRPEFSFPLEAESPIPPGIRASDIVQRQLDRADTVIQELKRIFRREPTSIAMVVDGGFSFSRAEGNSLLAWLNSVLPEELHLVMRADGSCATAKTSAEPLADYLGEALCDSLARVEHLAAVAWGLLNHAARHSLDRVEVFDTAGIAQIALHGEPHPDQWLNRSPCGSPVRVELSGEQSRGLLEEAHQLLRGDRAIEAQGILGRVVASDPFCAPAFQCQGEIAQAMGSYERAAAHFFHAARCSPRNRRADPMYRASSCWTLAGLSARALPALDTAITWMGLGGEIRAEYFVRRAELLLDVGRLRPALRDVEIALALDPEEATAQALRARLREQHPKAQSGSAARAPRPEMDVERRAVWRETARLNQAGRYEDARELTDRVLATSPEDFSALWQRGTAMNGLGDPLTALVSYVDALCCEDGYDRDELHAAIGTALSNLGFYEGAIEFFSQALCLWTGDPTRPDEATELSNVYDARGWCQFQTNKIEAALEDVNRALELCERNGHAHLNRGTYRQKLHEPASSVAIDFERALELEPEELAATALKNLVILWLECGDPTQARATGRRWILRSPDSWLAHYFCGRAADAQADWDAAITEYRSALGLLPVTAEPGLHAEVEARLTATLATAEAESQARQNASARILGVQVWGNRALVYPAWGLDDTEELGLLMGPANMKGLEAALGADSVRALRDKDLAFVVKLAFLSEVQFEGKALSRAAFEAHAQSVAVGGETVRVLPARAPRLGAGALLEINGARWFTSLPLSEETASIVLSLVL